MNSGFNLTDVWLGSGAINPQSGNVELRSYDTARQIADRPSISVIIYRRDPITQIETILAPQTIRIEILHPYRGGNEKMDAFQNEVSIQQFIIEGYKDHPTIPNTDILRQDRFVYNYLGRDLWFEITDYMPSVPGILLATGQIKPL